MPKAVRERLDLSEGTMMELEVKGQDLVLRKKDLWSKLWATSKGTVNPDQAEDELDEAEETWLARLPKPRYSTLTPS